GTYGGDPDNYGNELKQPEQLLNGEYGAWRTLGNHTGEGYTEEKAADLLLKKALLAESAADSVCGHFQWLLVSHDNPGRRQPDEGLRRIDKVGPFNYKGLLTIWEQPSDAYYRYMQHYRPQRIAPARSTVDESILQAADGYHYLYRLNCGGDEWTDLYGERWMQDGSQWSHSWSERFDGLSPYLASQTFNDSISSPLFKSSRWGRHQLTYHFPAQAGNYRVEMYFIEPWYRQQDAEGLRRFDIAINGKTVVSDLDIWAQVHYGKPYKRVVDIRHNGGDIVISFPKVRAGQAIISAIAIATPQTPNLKPQASNLKSQISTMWADFNKDIMVKTPDSLLPPSSYHAIEVEGRKVRDRMEWDFTVGVAKVYALRWKYHNAMRSRVLHVRITDNKGVVYKDDDITFLQTQEKKTKRKMTSITTGSQINAGTYHVVLTGDGISDMLFDPLTVE
ncbi:MAG: beta-galactosidase, partial [Prevotella sp.]|nr:beta-galactosidase [Prevotella sp.]